MLTAVRQNDGQKVAAWEAARSDGPFLCFCCGQQVALRRGEIKAPHFAHFPPVTCEYGTGESETHRRCKIAIYESLISHPDVSKCEMERNLGAVRPDVSAYINGVPVAIEIQLSNLSLDKIQYRTVEYARKRIFVLWLPVYTSNLDQELYAPKPWEEWLHTLYFGRVYYWLEGIKITPIHFREYFAQIRSRTHDYQKLSRKRVLIEGRSVSLTEDFKPLNRKSWHSRQISIPEAKLFIDSQPAWYM